jgi:hypothetical protein
MGNMSVNNSLTIRGIRLVAVLLLLGVIIGIIDFVLSKLLSSETQFKSIVTIFGILAIISVLIVSYGIYLIIKGRKEFNPNHEKNVIIAKKLILFWILFYVFAVFFILPTILPIVSTFTVGKPIVDVIMGIPLWLALIYLIKELAEPNIKKLLWLTFFVDIIVNPITGYVDVIAKNEASLFNLYLLTTLIAIIPTLMFVFCYYKTYIKLKAVSMAT